MKQRYCLWLPSTCRPLVTRDDAKWHLPPWGRRGISSRNCVVTSWLWTLASNKTGTSNCQSDKLIYLYTCIHIYIYKYVYRYIDIYMDRVIHLHTHTSSAAQGGGGSVKDNTSLHSIPSILPISHKNLFSNERFGGKFCKLVSSYPHVYVRFQRPDLRTCLMCSAGFC